MQAILLPLLTDVSRTDEASTQSLREMMAMAPAQSEAAPPAPRPRTSQGLFAAFAALQRPSFELRPHAPAQAVDFRLRLLQNGALDDAELARIKVPTLVVASAKDRLLPSLREGTRLQRALPRARRLVLPASGHCPMLETGVSIVDWLEWSGFLAGSPPPSAAGGGASLASSDVASAGMVRRRPCFPITGDPVSATLFHQRPLFHYGRGPFYHIACAPVCHANMRRSTTSRSAPVCHAHMRGCGLLPLLHRARLVAALAR